MGGFYNLIIDEDLNSHNLKNKIFIHNHFLDIHKNFNNEFKICYHPWSNPKLFEEDTLYLKNLKLRIVDALSENLNNFHKKNYSKKYWEIIIGYWSHSFLMMMLERWRILENLPKDIKYNLNVKKLDINKFIPQSLDEFNRIYYLGEYSSYLFQKIIEFNFKDLIKVVGVDQDSKIDLVRERFNLKKKNLRYYLSQIYSIFFKKKILGQKYAIIRSYLGFKDELKLNFLLKQFPIFVKDNYFLCNPNLDSRSKLKLNLNCKNLFEKFLTENLKFFLPVSFFEGFNIEKKMIDEISLPKNPKVIFSSNILLKSFISRYCAEKIENGSQLVLSSHGGSYGHYKHHFSEEQEILICNKYLSWGWTSKKNTKVKKFGIIRDLPKIKDQKKKYFTIILPANSPFEKTIETCIQASIQGEYIFNPSFKIINNLANEIKDEIILRFYPRNFGKNEKEIYKIYNPNIKIDEMKISSDELLSNTKILFSPYLGTGFLETLALNIPTVVFVSKRTDMIRDEAKPFYEFLKNAKIFFDDEELLADHINNVWKNVEKWWTSNEVQSNRLKFCDNFAYNEINKINNLKNLIIKDF